MVLFYKGGREADVKKKEMAVLAAVCAAAVGNLRNTDRAERKSDPPDGGAENRNAVF